MVKRYATHSIGADLMRFEPFRTHGALRAEQWPSPYSLGWLPYTYARAYTSDRPIYAVYSYDTPIAWYGLRGWVIPAVKYSRTTTKHQSAIERLLSPATRCATLVAEEGVIR